MADWACILAMIYVLLRYTFHYLPTNPNTASGWILYCSFELLKAETEGKKRVVERLRALVSDVERQEGIFWGPKTIKIHQPVRLPLKVPEQLQNQWQEFREASASQVRPAHHIALRKLFLIVTLPNTFVHPTGAEGGAKLGLFILLPFNGTLPWSLILSTS